MGYRIKTISELTGIPKSTLLAWERRYEVVTPERAENGYREYTDRDLAMLRELKRLVDAGYKVSEAITLLRVPEPQEPPQAPAVEAAPQRVQDELIQALLAFDRGRASALMDTLVFWSFTQLIDDLFFPVLNAIGDGWERGDVSVVQEHFASDFIKGWMSTMLLRLGCGPQDGPHVVCAGYPEEAHELGLLGLSIKLAMHGWRVTHLGANVPLGSLSHFVRTQSPLMVCVSAIHPVGLSELRRYAENLSQVGAPRTRVVIGGGGLPEALPSIEGVEWARTTSQLFGHNGLSVLH
ncbi:MAG: MerR family transcriptional regulator [Alphaproteobacteria bacterium]|nr:MerR family transcriptional regulator [Alphaproteobacteria bacterium]